MSVLLFKTSHISQDVSASSLTFCNTSNCFKMVFTALYFLPLLGFALNVSAQCVTAGYVPCLVPGANIPVAPPPLTPFGGSGFFSSVSSAAGDPIQVGKRSFEKDSELADGYTSIEKRQNSLCCRPAPVECLYTDGVPFCYVSHPISSKILT
jgi:hypothetical protein